MTVYDRIKQRRLELKMSQQELADKTGYKTRSAINKIENGLRDIGQSKIKQFAIALDVTPAHLMGWEEDNKQQIGTPYNPIVHKIPVLGYISAGLPLYAEEHIIDYTYTEYNGGHEYFALIVRGDSMNAAQINDGNKIIVRVQPDVDNGEIAVVRVNGDNATVKRFIRDGNMVHLIPQSYNTTHQIQTYNLKETKVDVIGKVIECKIEI